MPTKASAAPAPPGAPAPTPYEEHHHYRFRHPDVKNTVKARQRSFRAIQVERDNTHIQRRLNELRREPASRFHAPDGELSLKSKFLSVSLNLTKSTISSSASFTLNDDGDFKGF